MLQSATECHRVPFGKSGQKSTKIGTAGVPLGGKQNLKFHPDRTNGLGMARVQSLEVPNADITRQDGLVWPRLRPLWRVMSEFGTSKL